MSFQENDLSGKKFSGLRWALHNDNNQNKAAQSLQLDKDCAVLCFMNFSKLTYLSLILMQIY